MKIKVLPNQVEIENNSDKSLLQLCHDNGVHINSICKGQPKCAECRVRIVQGEQNVLPPNSVELSILGNNYYLDGRRLSCQVHVYGEITVDVSEQVERDLSSHKKVRGFRSQNKAHQSHAVLDTIMLKESSDQGPGSTGSSGSGGASAGADKAAADKSPEKAANQGGERHQGKRGDRGGSRNQHRSQNTNQNKQDKK